MCTFLWSLCCTFIFYWHSKLLEKLHQSKHNPSCDLNISAIFSTKGLTTTRGLVRYLEVQLYSKDTIIKYSRTAKLSTSLSAPPVIWSGTLPIVQTQSPKPLNYVWIHLTFIPGVHEQHHTFKKHATKRSIRLLEEKNKQNFMPYATRSQLESWLVFAFHLALHAFFFI